MISFDEARKLVLDTDLVLGTERIPFNQSLNRVLAEDIHSDMMMPPFDKSAVDGYACRREDLGNELKIVEIIPAGKSPKKKIGINQCAKIMTGAPLPEGADAVIIIEDTVETVLGKIRYQKEKVKDNICYRGEDIKEGETVLFRSTLIKPQHIAVMAATGNTNPLVYKKVRIAVISTGDELVEPESKPGLSQIRNSNAHQLKSQIESINMIADYMGIASDDEESTQKMITHALERNDIVLLTGGVSMGDYDYVPKVLEDIGVQIKFDSIAVQPGRPTVFGKRDKQFVFGLPGNPVSAFVQFELLVKPLIYKLSGHQYKPVELMLTVGKEYSRRKSTRLSWIPVKIGNGSEVIPVEYHGSAHINALTEASGLISLKPGETLLKKGEQVHVRQI
jgi:molybdopterin molybdotransferase